MSFEPNNFNEFDSQNVKIKDFSYFEPIMVLNIADMYIEKYSELLKKPFTPKSITDFS